MMEFKGIRTLQSRGDLISISYSLMWYKENNLFCLAQLFVFFI